jgi:hypothetical protein
MFSLLSIRSTFFALHGMDNKKPWDCRLLPVPTAVEVSSPVLFYLQQGDIPPEIGTRMPGIIQKVAGKTSKSSALLNMPRDIAQMRMVFLSSSS